MNLRALVASIAITIIAVGGLAAVAQAHEGSQEGPDCSQPTLTIHHDAVTHVEHHAAQTHEKTVVDSPAVWQNFSPNDSKKTFIGPPSWPTDPRGTWHHVGKPIPPGQDGPDGVYANGNPAKGGNWFYRHHAVTHTETVVDVPAYDEEVVDQEAYDEVVDNPDYPCDETESPSPSVSVTPSPSETPTTEPPVTETPTDEPSTPTSTPTKTPVPTIESRPVFEDHCTWAEVGKETRVEGTKEWVRQTEIRRHKNSCNSKHGDPGVPVVVEEGF